jgi:hypothetical protein
LSEHAEVAERAAKQLAAWQQATLAARLDEDAQESALTSEEMDRLRALGYL